MTERHTENGQRADRDRDRERETEKERDRNTDRAKGAEGERERTRKKEKRRETAEPPVVEGNNYYGVKFEDYYEDRYTEVVDLNDEYYEH